MTVSLLVVLEYKSLSVFVYLPQNCKQILFTLSSGEVRHQCAFIHLFWQAWAFPTSFAGLGFGICGMVYAYTLPTRLICARILMSWLAVLSFSVRVIPFEALSAMAVVCQRLLKQNIF